MAEKSFSDVVQKFIKEELTFYIGQHPVNYYLQLDKKQDLLGDAMYNIYTDDWIVLPTTVPERYAPHERFKPVWEQARDWMDKFTMGIMELQRDVKDVEELENWLVGLDGEELGWLGKRIEDKIGEVNDDLDILAEQFTEVHEERKKSYAESVEPEQALEDWMRSRSWRKGNIQFKFLEKYGLVSLLANLRHVAKSEELSDEEKVEETKKLLTRFNLMFEKMGTVVVADRIERVREKVKVEDYYSDAYLEGADRRAIEKYKKQLRKGKYKPVLISEEKWLEDDPVVDGCHRLIAAHELGMEYIDAYVDKVISTSKKGKKKGITYEEESEKIRENQKKPEAQKPHKFRPAEWTFGNGHPRCLLCGDEETIDGMCEGYKPEKRAYRKFSLKRSIQSIIIGKRKGSGGDRAFRSFNYV